MNLRPRVGPLFAALSCAVIVGLVVAMAVWLGPSAAGPASGTATPPVATYRPAAAGGSLATASTPAPGTPPATASVSAPANAQATAASSVPDAETVAAAARYAKAAGYEAGIAVIDTTTGQSWSAGTGDDDTFSTESVAKLFIAARLRVEDEWTDSVASIAWTMITESDDDSANALYGQVGGDGVMQWVMDHYNVPRLGDGPSRSGWWGLFHVRPIELAKLLVDLRKDERVWNWLGKAMAATTKVASDGFDQSFGIRQVDPTAPIKQGWSYDYSLPGEPAELNSTGFVDNGRYAVVVMVRGPHSSYSRAISAMVTDVTKVALTGRPVP